jgi:hypothetical protein
MRLCFHHVERRVSPAHSSRGSILKLPESLFRRLSLFAIQKKNVAGEGVSNQVYEKTVVLYIDKIVRVKEFVGAVDIGGFRIRLGAKRWIRPVANRIGCFHRS